MRGVLVFAGPLAVLAATACVAGALPSRPERADAPPPSPAPTDLIAVGAQSNVCVSVHVDQRIWPRPLDADSARIFSGSLMSEVRRIYEQRGGSNNMPGTQNQARFFTNESGTNPFCQDRQTDVFVDMRYGPRRDGTPFVIDYRISRGTALRAGRVELDVAEEMRAGRIRGFSQRRTMRGIIWEDIVSRAPMIVDQLAVGQD
jgi:hypothetical protein